jgi:hypothetical protein
MSASVREPTQGNVQTLDARFATSVRFTSTTVEMELSLRTIALELAISDCLS